jgi:predicted nucleotidyltransferase
MGIHCIGFLAFLTSLKMIEKLFTSKNRVKMLEYFIFHKQRAKLREISRETKIPVSAVSREFDNLVKLSILKKEDDNIILNEECNFLVELRNILLKTDSFTFELRKLFQKLFQNKGIDYVFVFGSFANEVYSSDSDIDLFVVGNISSIELTRMLRPIERKLNREINAVIWPMQDLKKKSKSGFIRDIAKKKVIMIYGDENELREIIGRK